MSTSTKPIVEHALEMAARGCFVFPVKPRAKVPAVRGWQNWATRDADKIREWWARHPDCNYGVFAGKFGDGKALLVVDVDRHGGADGFASLARLELLHGDLSTTFTVETPSGGRHLYFVVDRPVRQGANVLGPGLDVRSKGGYVVGPGSVVDGEGYAVIQDGGSDATIH